MPYEISNPPDRIKKLPTYAQKIWIATFNSAYEQYGHDEERANKVAWASVKKLYRKNDSGKWVKKKNSYSFPICFSDAIIEQEMEIHILPVGEWKHELYGDIKITETEIEEFVQHFDQGIRKGVTITEGHRVFGGNELPAIGWFKQLINKKAEGLWGIVEWTDKGRELLEQKAYKYFSPEYCTVYEDPETHKLYNNVLTGGALTNSPYFKELKAIVMSEPIILNQFKNMAEKIKEEVIENSKKEIIEDKEVFKEGDKCLMENGEKGEMKMNKNGKMECMKIENKKKASENIVDKLTYREPMKNLSEKLIYQVINSAGNIEIEDKAELSEFKKELLRTGTWKHGAGKDGILEITKETLRSIVKNFKDKVLDNVFVPLGHPTTDDPSCNVGEVVDLTIEGEDENKLVATINVKEKGIIEKIKDGLIKCISASLTENYSRKDTGEYVGPTLFHAALVSEPYIKGMAPFIPLSEDMKDSTIVSIMNMEEPLTLQDLLLKIENMTEEIKAIKEIKLNETKEEETKETESETEVKTEDEKESPEVGVKTEKEEEKETEVKTEEEETETEESESEAEEAEEEEGVALAEAEKMFATLLSEGRVTPAEKDLLIPALASNTRIELSDGETVISRNQLYEYLKKQPRKFSLSEDGGTPDKKKGGKKIEMTEDVNRAASKIAKALNLSEEERLEIIKEVEEEKRK